MKFAKLVVIFLAIAFIASAQVITTDLTGKWKVSWFYKGVEGGTPNVLNLTEYQESVTGIFTSDDGEACVVTGTNINRNVSLTVNCNKFTIWLNGRITDEGVVTGNYIAPAFSNGSFKMEKQICLLPEGCKE